MAYSRRHLLGAGAAAALFGGSAKAQTLAEIVAGLKDPPRVPAKGHSVTVDAAVDPRLLARARKAFDANRHNFRHHDMIGITDFSRASREPRFFLLDTASGRISGHLVCHGRGSDPNHSGWLDHFSNEVGSAASSAGAYVTGDYYYGKYGRAMRLHGLERRNCNAEARAIVVHSAWYAEPEVIDEQGKLGRSEGCFTFSQASLREVLARLGPGRLLFADKV